MDTRTVILRLQVLSRDFAMRKGSLDAAVTVAVAKAQVSLIGDGFNVLMTSVEIVDQAQINMERGVEEARRQSRPDGGLPQGD